MVMQRVTYISTARLGLSDADIASIVDTARSHNQTAGITGVLLYNRINFLQTVEGEESAVGPLLIRIAEDNRHGSVVIVQRETVSERAFGDWSMGFHAVAAAVHRQANDAGVAGNGFALPEDGPQIPQSLLTIYKSFDTLSISRGLD